MSALPVDTADLVVTPPDPLARAPRVALQAPPHERLHPAPASLQGALVAVVCRDTRGLPFSAAQRLTHLPASPLLSLSWFHGTEGGWYEDGPGGVRWRPFGAAVVVAGSPSRPRVCWSPGTGRGGMLLFTADVARALWGIDPVAVRDRCVPAAPVLGPGWTPLLQALLAADDDAAVLAALQRHVAPRWQALHGRAPHAPSLRQLGRHWVERLARQAHAWRRTHGPRQVERRIKAWSGRSLREWQSLVRADDAFFALREQLEAGRPVAWAALAQDHGFADQPHLVRAARRVTGFAPGEFAQRFLHDESFWAYRLWV